MRAVARPTDMRLNRRWSVYETEPVGEVQSSPTSTTRSSRWSRTWSPSTCFRPPSDERELGRPEEAGLAGLDRRRRPARQRLVLSVGRLAVAASGARQPPFVLAPLLELEPGLAPGRHELGLPGRARAGQRVARVASPGLTDNRRLLLAIDVGNTQTHLAPSTDPSSSSTGASRQTARRPATSWPPRSTTCSACAGSDSPTSTRRPSPRSCRSS